MSPEELDRYYITGPVPETPDQAPAPAPEPWTTTQVVGKPLPRIDAYERVSGTAEYASDVVLPNMLHGAILRCPHAHAMVKKVDTSAAEKMPGVVAIITDASPEAKISWYGGRTPSRLFDPHCRFEGEEVAAVAAETPYQAWDAARAIKVDYEVLPSISTEEEAVRPGAPALHGTSNRVSEKPPAPAVRGDVEKGFAESDAVHELTFTTACELHNPMESFGCVARWDGTNFLTVWDSIQGVFPSQQGLAQALGLPLANIRVIGPYMGGGFGAKLSGHKYHVMTALLAKKSARPVKLFLTREEAMLATGNRPWVKMTLKAGAKKDGTLQALDLRIVSTGGAYANGSGGVDFQFRDLYLCPNVRTQAVDYYSTTGPQRPFRAPGHPQGNWALEQMMDVLAEAIGMDPVEFRLKNVPTFSQISQNLPYSTSGLKDCLSEGAKAFGWTEARQKARASTGPIRRGVGVAAGMWQGGSGGPPSTAIVRVFADGSVNLNMGASDIGCGTKTWAAQIVAEELGVPMTAIRIEHADTGTTQYATASGGSKTVPTEGPAIRAAALEAKAQLLAMAAEQLKLPQEELRLSYPEIVSTKDATRKVALRSGGGGPPAPGGGAAAVPGLQQLSRQGVVVGVGYRGPNPTDRVTRPFAAQFAEVEVNTRTGEVKVLRFLAAQDSGRVMNQRTFENQTFGGVVMGLGLALTEGRVLDAGQTGKVLTVNLHDYKLPTSMDVAPTPVCVPIDLHDQFSSTGAKGLGEPSTTPTASAVANAVCHAIGVRVLDSPITPARICQLLAARRG